MVEAPTTVTVGFLIRATREASGLSQRELGQRVGKTQTGVNYWEKNKRNLTVHDLINVARALDVAPAALIPGGEVTPEPLPYELPLRTGRKAPHQTIYDANDVMIAAGMTPETAAWLVEQANAAEQVYRCPACQRAARWTDGTSRAAGDRVDEFWCRTCGAETPLNAMTRLSVDDLLQELADVRFACDRGHPEVAGLRAAITRVRRLSRMTIDASCRTHAIQQAEDTLTVLADQPSEAGAGTADDATIAAIVRFRNRAAALTDWANREFISQPEILQQVLVTIGKLNAALRGEEADHA
ncbi:helix-turn-helix transcriptional regulator [Streptosporangiaceae bacterium NEAU-GS5]|nr:helix-turn-helix transcriptional regulator [Streptosporangiaceae bacterium NEAU-GS5]